jgi:hypothetical protein
MMRSIVNLTVAAACHDDDVLAKLVQMTGLTLRKLRNRLQAFDGRTLVRNVLAEDLPLDYESLSVISVGQARVWGLASEIARVWEIPTERAEEVLRSVHGRTLLRRAFDVDAPDSGDDEESDCDDALEEPTDVEEWKEEAGEHFSSLAEEWSRPRQVSRVLRLLGFAAPARLRSSRFQTMLEELRSRGIEACLADDPAQRVLDIDAPSPGIAAKLRLRREGSGEPVAPELLPATSGEATGGWSRLRPVRALFAQLGLAVPSEMGQEEFGLLIETLEIRGYEVATSDGARLTPLHDAVPLDAEIRLRHDALAAPPASLRSVKADDHGDSRTSQGRMINDYQRASLRLEVLTAGIGPAIASHEGVTKCVEIATAGLAVPRDKQDILERVGVALTQTARDPLVVLTSLVERLDPEDGEVLLREYAMLHPEHVESNRLLSEHWSALCEMGEVQGDASF